MFLVSKRKIGGKHAFFIVNKGSLWKKKDIHLALYFTAF